MLKYFFISFLLVVAVVLALAGFRGEKTTRRPIEVFPDMDHQPKYQPQHPSEFFADKRAARPPVKGTVPLGYSLPTAQLETGSSTNPVAQTGFGGVLNYHNTGKIEGSFGDGIPLEVTADLMTRGAERFEINCAICHGRTGAGNGIIKQYGMDTIASLHQERLRTMPDGEIFDIITNGKNTMGPYGGQITVEDRWAIVAYVRALQRSQNGTMADVPPDQAAELNK